jgi:hypothetical protein
MLRTIGDNLDDVKETAGTRAGAVKHMRAVWFKRV